ncbi:MAG: hypothetical protein KDB16_02075, partial [Acidimicrobiales bacterium]|nr:hypothetical protein [Acidimicrobiales bacterium]
STQFEAHMPNSGRMRLVRAWQQDARRTRRTAFMVSQRLPLGHAACSSTGGLMIFLAVPMHQVARNLAGVDAWLCRN